MATELVQSKHALVKQIWAGAAVMALLDAPMMIWRSQVVGWHPQLLAHVVLCIATLFIALFRHEIKFPFLSNGLIFFSFALGVIGTVTLGMTGTGFFWISFGTFLVCLLYGAKAGSVIASFAACYMLLIGMCFVNGLLKPPFDMSVHASSASGWFNFLVVACTVPFITLSTVSKFQRTLITLISQISEQRDQLLAQRDQLAAQQKQLEDLARHDPLTGLPSLRMAKDRLEMAIAYAARTREKVAVMFIDLDGFKKVNDTYGHNMGDAVLKEIAKRLEEVVRDTDTVARIGGDEFIAIIANASDHEGVRGIAEEMIRVVGRPISMDGVTIHVGASIGIALYPDHGDDYGRLKALSDNAMYCAKRGGKNTLRFYEKDCK